jgi:hypothetical protein
MILKLVIKLVIIVVLALLQSMFVGLAFKQAMILGLVHTCYDYRYGLSAWYDLWLALRKSIIVG